MSKVSLHPSGCWEWTQTARAQSGHGRFSMGGRAGKIEPSHRIAWELFRGPIPPDLNVCHHCDNPPCVNPDHLFLGTQKDNIRDAFAKDRMPRREERTQAKMTTEAANKIRRLYAAGGITQAQLAEQFGISQALISMIISGQRWT